MSVAETEILHSTSTANGSDQSLHLFVSGFTAGDVAEPLQSFDDTTDSSFILAGMQQHQTDVVGLRTSGIASGWASSTDLTEGGPPPARAFDVDSMLSHSAPLSEVVGRLNMSPVLFVKTFGHVSGVIHRNCLQKPAMRMWLFGLITITELRVTQMIDKLLPDDAWRCYLSEGRLQKAHELQRERHRQGQQRRLLDCLQFADKGRIVAREDKLRVLTRFDSRRAVDDFVKALQDLRNNLAHAQDIAGDWDVIHELAMNLHRIVLGPPA